MALSANKAYQERLGDTIALPVKGGEEIFQGSLVCLEGGLAVKGKTATGLVTVGIAKSYVDNTEGADGDVWVEVKKGIFLFKNSADADEITLSDVGSDCYVVDDETVAKTNGDTGSGATRSKAGKVFDVCSDGVWVDLR